jgi:hypothetical protein
VHCDHCAAGIGRRQGDALSPRMHAGLRL